VFTDVTLTTFDHTQTHIITENVRRQHRIHLQAAGWEPLSGVRKYADLEVCARCR